MTQFDRCIERIIKNHSLEERYIDGDLRGWGRWSFEERGGKCYVSYHCKVSAQTAFTRLVFRCFGAYSHHKVYKDLLQALKAHCEK